MLSCQHDFASRAAYVLRRRWLIWAVMAACYLIVYFHRIAPSVVADHLMATFSLSGVALGNLSAIYLYVYGFMQIPSGLLADYIGPRRTAIGGMFLAALGCLMFALAPCFSILYLGRLLTGLGVSVIFISTMTIQANWFRSQEFGTITGLTSFVGNSGGLLAATPLAILVTVIGWRGSFQVIALASLLVMIACLLIVRNSPQSLGLPSIAEITAWQEAAAAGSAVAEPGEFIEEQVVAKEPQGLRDLWAGLKQVLRNKYTWPSFLAFGGIYGAMMAFAGIWGVPYLMQIYDMTRAQAANYIMAFQFGSVVGAPLIGYMSDRIRSRKIPFVTSAVCSMICWLLFAFWNGGKPPVQILFPFVFFMAASGHAIILTVACGKEVNPPHLAGTAMGTVNTSGFLGGAIMQPLFGWALDLRWEGLLIDGVKIYPLAAYQLGFLLCVGACLIALVGTLLMKESHCRNVYGEISAGKM